MSKKRVIVPLFGDSHAGSILGLLNPTTELNIQDETGMVRTEKVNLKPIQEFIWGVYTDGIKSTVKLAGDDEIFPIHMGDMSDGKKYPEGLISSRLSDQIIIAVDNLSEWLKYDNVKHLRIIEGTPAHNFGESSTEQLVDTICKSKFPDKDIQTQYYGLLNINNVIFDLTHHGPSAGKRVWLKGNEFRFYIRSLVMKELIRKNKAPNIIGRAHTHEPVEEWIWVEDHRACGVITPPLCFPNDFAKQVTNGVYLVTIGMVAFETISYDDGRISFFPHWMKKTIDIRSKEIF